jgi:hypothetical protein
MYTVIVILIDVVVVRPVTITTLHEHIEGLYEMTWRTYIGARREEHERLNPLAKIQDIGCIFSTPTSSTPKPLSPRPQHFPACVFAA